MNDGHVNMGFDTSAGICNTGSMEFMEHLMALQLQYCSRFMGLEFRNDSCL